jgi:hypothetical protein
LRSALVAAYFLGLSVVMTWPQAVSLQAVPPHHDALFSIWRLAWIDHALWNGLPLFDANIFHPAKRTLAYSDATLLQGIVASGLIQLRLSPVVAYNLLTLASFVACGIGAYLWARSLGTSRAAGLVAGTIYSVAPMRFGHYMHLEVLWTQWIPLALWACRRLVDVGDARAAGALGAFITLQALSGLYAFVFLLTTIPVYLAAIFLLEGWRPSRRTIAYVALAALPSMAIVVGYARPFLANASGLGPRALADVREYSATMASFFAAPRGNWLYGWTSDWGGRELELSAGIVPLILGVLALAGVSRRWWSAFAVLLLGLGLTLGANGPLFGLLRDYGVVYSGLRAPARAAMIAHCGLAVVAAAGLDRLRQSWSARASQIAVVLVLSALVAEYWYEFELAELPSRPSAYAAWLADQPDRIVAEFPMPTLSTLPGNDASYQYESIAHWRTLVNGYSGYYPLSYLELVNACTTWNSACVAELRQRGVTAIAMHVSDRGDAASSVTVDMLERDPSLEPVLTSRSIWDAVRVYRWRSGH